MVFLSRPCPFKFFTWSTLEYFVIFGVATSILPLKFQKKELFQHRTKIKRTESKHLKNGGKRKRNIFRDV